MSDTFKLHGDISIGPACSGASSGSPNTLMSLDESMTLSGSAVSGDYVLSGDSPVSVGLGPLASVHLVVVKAIGGKVRVRLTSADGSSQAIPVDGLALLLSSSVPFTAIDLTRVTGTLTTVKVTLGEKAS